MSEPVRDASMGMLSPLAATSGGGLGAAHDAEAGLSLVCRVRTRLCALPLGCVVETMRPLPVEPLAGAPAFVRGLALIRGVPLPVVDAARLLGDPEEPCGRFVVVDTGSRRVALAFGSVLGVRALAATTLHPPAPLLGEAHAEVVAAIGRLDSELLLVLGNTRILVDEAAVAEIR